MPPVDFEPSPLAPRRTPEEQARDQDLGFGAVVGRSSQQRLLNRDGSFNVARVGLGFLENLAPYHQLRALSWSGFFGFVAQVTDSYRPAILALIVFFIVGSIILFFTDTNRAILEAGNSMSEENLV